MSVLSDGEIDVLAALATPGPWEVVMDSCDCGGEYGCPHGEYPRAIRTPHHDPWMLGDGSGDVCRPEEPTDYLNHERGEITQFSLADAELIAASRELVPALLARARDAEARLRAIRDWATADHGGRKRPVEVWPGLAEVLGVQP